jgi:hypothetical protein
VQSTDFVLVQFRGQLVSKLGHDVPSEADASKRRVLV